MNVSSTFFQKDHPIKVSVLPPLSADRKEVRYYVSTTKRYLALYYYFLANPTKQHVFHIESDIMVYGNFERLSKVLMSCEADPIGVGILPTWAASCTCYSRILQRCLVLTLTVAMSKSDADLCENIFSACLPTYVKIYSHESASEWIMVTLLCGRDRPKLETAVHKPALYKFVLTPAYRFQLSGSTMYSSRSISSVRRSAAATQNVALASSAAAPPLLETKISTKHHKEYPSFDPHRNARLRQRR